MPDTNWINDLIENLRIQMENGRVITQKMVPTFEVKDGKWCLNPNGLRIIRIE